MIICDVRIPQAMIICYVRETQHGGPPYRMTDLPIALYIQLLTVKFLLALFQSLPIHSST